MGLRFWKLDGLDDLFAKRLTNLATIEQLVDGWISIMALAAAQLLATPTARTRSAKSSKSSKPRSSRFFPRSQHAAVSCPSLWMVGSHERI
jgi:hypothetical protein